MGTDPRFEHETLSRDDIAKRLRELGDTAHYLAAQLSGRPDATVDEPVVFDFDPGACWTYEESMP